MQQENPQHEILIPDFAKPKIQNVVGTMNLGFSLQLTQIYWKAKNAEYNPSRFAAVIMRLQKPKTTALIFKSGKMVITGAKSQFECELAGRKYAKIIDKIVGNEKGNQNRVIKIQNVVASSDVKFPIHLDELQLSYQNLNDPETRPSTNQLDKVQYEPQVFPGLVFRMKIPKITFLIFVSGKIVVTGAKNQKMIVEGFNKIYRIVQNYKKGKVKI